MPFAIAVKEAFNIKNALFWNKKIQIKNVSKAIGFRDSLIIDSIVT
jgi:hypothetical protein